MNQDQTEKTERRRRSIVYLVIAFILLAVMGLVWSLDSSIVTILFGASLFFLFLFFRSKPPAASSSTGDAPFRRRQERRTPGQKKPFFRLDELFSKEAKTASYHQHASAPANPRRFATAVSFFVGAIFFIIILSVVVGQVAEYSDEAITYYQLGEQHRWNGQYDSADHYYLEALKIQPDYQEALLGYGNSLLGENRNDTAAATFGVVLKINDESEEARYGKALALYYAGQYQLSLKELRQLMSVNPTHFDGILLAGDGYQMQQQYDSAMYWYEEGYAQRPTGGLCNAMAYIHDTKGNTDKAIELYREALGYDSTRIEIYKRLGELFPGRDGEWYRQKALQLKNAGY